MRPFDRAVLVRQPAVVARCRHAVVGAQGLVSLGHILGLVLAQVAEGRELHVRPTPPSSAEQYMVEPRGRSGRAARRRSWLGSSTRQPKRSAAGSGRASLDEGRRDDGLTWVPSVWSCDVSGERTMCRAKGVSYWQEQRAESLGRRARSHPGLRVLESQPGRRP